MINNRICILGTGAYATALGILLSKNNNTIFLWGIDKKEINDINSGYNKKYFGERKFSSSLSATDDLRVAVGNSKYIVLAVPSTSIDEVINKLKDVISPKSKLVLINASKGFDKDNNSILSTKIKKLLKGYKTKVVTICGPSFAEEVFSEKPTIINAASSSKANTIEVCKLFDSNFMKIIPIDDEKGIQIYSSLKNLLAIGVGMIRELYNSIDAESSILTIGISEMRIIGKAMGAKRNTIMDFCGIGDVFLTCTSDLSRNFGFGKEIAKNGLEKTVFTNSKTVEGYYIYEVVRDVISKHKLNTPLFQSIISVLSGEKLSKEIISTVWDSIANDRINNFNKKNYLATKKQ